MSEMFTVEYDRTDNLQELRCRFEAIFVGGMKFRKKVTLIIGIIVIVVAFGVMSFKYFVEPMLMIPGKNPYVSPTWVARGAGGAIHSTISAAHSNYLRNGTDYDLDDVLSNIAFASHTGITYQPTDTDTPALGEIASNVAGTAIILNTILNNKQAIFKWDYTPRNGDTPALLTRRTVDSDF